jgi:hypothetical protein
MPHYAVAQQFCWGRRIPAYPLCCGCCRKISVIDSSAIFDIIEKGGKGNSPEQSVLRQVSEVVQLAV